MNLEDLYRVIRDEHVQVKGIVDTVADPLLVLDRDLCVLTASRAFYETFKVARDDTIGRHIYELGAGQWDVPELRHLLEDVIPKSTAVIDYEVEHDFPNVGRRTMLLSARRLFNPENNTRTLLLSMVDATERRKREAEQHKRRVAEGACTPPQRRPAMMSAIPGVRPIVTGLPMVSAVTVLRMV
jgi:PAS domain-containing protein